MAERQRGDVAAVKKRRQKSAPINGARALMASRKERKDSLDFYATPPWATRALMDHVFTYLFAPFTTGYFGRTAWEPACGEGHLAEVLREYFKAVRASDIRDYGYAPMYRCGDFFTTWVGSDGVDWIITNPPYSKAEQFTLRALDLASIGVAMFVRVQFLETVGRYERLFKEHPPTLIAFFSERVPIHKGKWKPEGSTATAYCWLVWVKDRDPLPPYWIPPGCRQRLTKPDDRERFAAWSLPKEMREAAE